MNHLFRPFINIANLCITTLLIAVTATSVVLASSYSTTFSASNAREEIIEVPDWGGPKINVVVYLPSGWSADDPVIIVLHGANRNIDHTLQTWELLAEQKHFLLVVPSFSDRRFPGSEDYPQGGLRSGKLSRNSAFNSIEPIFNAIRERYGLKQNEYRLFGHSAGAQFVHRFLLFHPEARAHRVVLSMAGWYTMPDPTIRWPYGLRGTGIDPSKLTEFFARDTILVLGESDTDRRDPLLRRNQQADRQGLDRVERGEAYFNALRTVALYNDHSYNWQIRVLPDVGHDSTGSAEKMVEWLAEH